MARSHEQALLRRVSFSGRWQGLRQEGTHRSRSSLNVRTQTVRMYDGGQYESPSYRSGYFSAFIGYRLGPGGVPRLRPYGYGYAATAPLYDYAAPGYGYAAPGYVAPGTAGTTVIIVTPGAPAYTAPPVASGYYNYAPGYWGGGYGGWRAGW